MKKGTYKRIHSHIIDWIVELCIKHVSLYKNKTINKQDYSIHSKWTKVFETKMKRQS